MDDNNRFVKMMENYVNMLERENNRLKVEPNTLREEIKRLKGLLVNESNLDASIIKDAELIRELKAEIKELKLLSCNDDCQDDINSLIKLKAENETLKDELNKTKCGGINQ